MIVSFDLPPETAQRLSERAAQEGQTLETFLRNLAKQQAQVHGGTPDGEDDEIRPWRGVFVLDYPIQELCHTELALSTNLLPSLPPEVILNPRRLVDDDE